MHERGYVSYNARGSEGRGVHAGEHKVCVRTRGVHEDKRGATYGCIAILHIVSKTPAMSPFFTLTATGT